MSIVFILGGFEISKSRDLLFEKCVERAKVCIRTMENARYEVASLAFKCCIFDKKIPNADIYSVRSFATKIGIKKSTLHDWMKAKKVYDSLSDTDKDLIKPSELSILARSISLDNKLNGRMVRSKYVQLKEVSEETHKINLYIKNLNSILYNIKDEKKLKLIDQDSLSEVLHVCREIVFILGKNDKKTKYANVE